MNRTTESRPYTYVGPEQYHGLVGQVMAAVGITGSDSKGRVVVTIEEGAALHLSCVFGDFSSEAYLIRPERYVRDIKDCLLHLYDRSCGRERGPWGYLIGVRPTKLVHLLFEQGRDEQGAKDVLTREYAVDSGVADRLVAMAELQRPYVSVPLKVVDLYVGIPYCPSHCLYCSFPSRLIGAEKGAAVRAFAEAVETDLKDLRQMCDEYGLTVQTIYVGGGTPTCLPLDCLRRILDACGLFAPVREWTVEAGRPDTAGEEVLQVLRDCGVDRISVNPQTMQQRLLDALGRRHTVKDIFRMYERAKKMGFSVINMDFIAGLPGQTMEDMKENMENICKLRPENVTIHTLALKKKAPLFHHPLRQNIPPEEETAAMVRYSRERLVAEGYIPYYMYRQKYMAASFANVGYARPGTIGVYNIDMMEERQTVLAAGPGGATKFAKSDGHSLEKLYMPKDIDRYIQALPEKMAKRRHLCAIVYGGDS